MIDLPTQGGSFTSSQIQELFPSLLLSGENLEFLREHEGFAVHMRGFYTVEEMVQIQADLVELRKMETEIKILIDEADSRLLAAMAGDNGELAAAQHQGLRWAFMRSIRLEEQQQ